MSSIPSPQKTIEYLSRMEGRAEQAIHRLSLRSEMTFFLATAVMSSLLFFCVGYESSWRDITVACVVYLLNQITRESRIGGFYVLVGSAFIVGSKVSNELNAQIWQTSLVLFFCFVPLIFLVCSRGMSTYLRIVGFSLIALAECYIGSVIGISDTDLVRSVFLIPPFGHLLTYVYLLYEDKVHKWSLKDSQLWARLLNPTSFLLVTFKEIDFKFAPGNTFALVRGGKNLLISALFVKLNLILKASFETGPEWMRIMSAYPNFYFEAAAYTLYFWGLLQMMGFLVNDPYQFPFLAVDPVDRWTRWNIFTSQWYKTVVFFPVVKKTKSVLMGVVAISICSIIIHLKSESIGRLLLGQWEVLRENSVIKIVTPFTLQGVSIYFFFLFPSLFGNKNKLSGWWGVAFTWIIMSFIYYTRL